jgi:hypothetical protein
VACQNLATYGYDFQIRAHCSRNSYVNHVLKALLTPRYTRDSIHPRIGDGAKVDNPHFTSAHPKGLPTLHRRSNDLILFRLPPHLDSPPQSTFTCCHGVSRHCVRGRCPRRDYSPYARRRRTSVAGGSSHPRRAVFRPASLISQRAADSPLPGTHRQ